MFSDVKFLQDAVMIIAIVVIGMYITSEILQFPSVSGKLSEIRTKKALLNIDKNLLIISNAIYKYGENKEKTAEIDMIVIHRTGIYVIENKGYSGWIFGKQKDFQWTQTFGRRRKYKFYNPIKQNNKHIEVLNEILGKGQFYRNLVIFGDTAKLKKIQYDETVLVENRSRAMIKLRDVFKNNQTLYTEEKQQEIFNELKEKGFFDKETRKQHIKNIKNLKKSA